MCNQQSLRSAQSDQSLCVSLEYSMKVKRLTEHHLEFLSLKEGRTCSSESILVKIPHCWKSHVTAHILIVYQTLLMLYYYSPPIFTLLTCSIPVESMYLQSEWKTVWIFIRWLHQKPADLDHVPIQKVLSERGLTLTFF